MKVTPVLPADEGAPVPALLLVDNPLTTTGRPPETRRQFLHRAFSHHLRLKRMGLVSALCTVPACLYMAYTFNYGMDVYTSRGHDPTASVSIVDFSVALEGSDARWLRGLSSAFSTLFTVAWCPTWLHFVTKACGDYRLSNWFYVSVVALQLIGAVLLYTEIMASYTTNGRLWGFLVMVVAYSAQSHYVGRVIGFNRMGRIVVLQWVTIALILIFYLLLVQDMFFTGTETTRVLLRLLLHPVLLELSLFACRFWARLVPTSDTKPTMHYAYVNYTSMNAFGRLLMFSLSTAWGTALCVIGLSVIEVAFRMTMLERDHFYYRVLMGKAAADRYARTPRAQKIKAELVGADQISEDSGILVACLVTILFRTSGSRDAPNVNGLLLNAAIQWMAELLTDLSPVALVYLFSSDFTDSSASLQTHGSRFNALISRAHANVDRVIETWHGRTYKTALLMGLGSFTWVAYVLRTYFSPCEFQCAFGEPEELAGSKWFHWVSCELTKSY